MRSYKTLLLIISALVILTIPACQPSPAVPTQTETSVVPTAEKTPTVDIVVEEPPTYVYQPNEDLPTSLINLIETQNLTQAQGTANEISYTIEIGSANPAGNWVYALAAPFPTVTDEVSASWLKNLWQGQPEDAVQTLLVSEDNLPALTSILGEAGETVRTLPKDQLLETAWTTQNTWAIIPFEEIQPRWKILVIDGQSPIHKVFAAEQYALNVPISVSIADSDDAS